MGKNRKIFCRLSARIFTTPSAGNQSRDYAQNLRKASCRWKREKEEDEKEEEEAEPKP